MDATLYPSPVGPPMTYGPNQPYRRPDSPWAVAKAAWHRKTTAAAAAAAAAASQEAWSAAELEWELFDEPSDD